MDRIAEARELAKDLLGLLELASAPVETVLMKAMRLARLKRDQDAQRWLNYEMSGYPDKFDWESLGTCKRYAIQGSRVSVDGKYYTASLPKIEAEVAVGEGTLSKANPGYSARAKNFIEKSATEQLLFSQIKIDKVRQDAYVQRRSLLVSLRSGLHAYVSDLFISLEFGDAAESIFEAARQSVDEFVRVRCPKAAEQILAINDRMSEGGTESLASALTSCRRLLLTVADSLFPAREETYSDSNGKERIVGTDQYKNRLLAFIDQRIGSDSSFALIETEIEHLSARLDAVYEKACKGVHANVSPAEARLAVIHTYLFLGEVARFPEVA